jgi:methionine-rich copper-binding protein CopC
LTILEALHEVLALGNFVVIYPRKKMKTDRKLRGGVAFVITLVLFALAVSDSKAHARLTCSIPENKAQLAQSPGKIELWFNELLEEGSFNVVEVFAAKDLKGKKRTNLAKTPVVDAEDKTHLIVKLGEMADGEYVVEWRVLSRDGHSAPGRIRFQVESHK